MKSWPLLDKYGLFPAKIAAYVIYPLLTINILVFGMFITYSFSNQTIKLLFFAFITLVATALLVKANLWMFRQIKAFKNGI